MERNDKKLHTHVTEASSVKAEERMKDRVRDRTFHKCFMFNHFLKWNEALLMISLLL